MTQAPIRPALSKISDCLYRVAAKAVIVKDSMLLLVHEGEGWYGTPGGGIEHNQSPHEALVRELKEEVNLDISTDAISEQPLFVSVGGTSKGLPRVTLFYLVDVDDESLIDHHELEYTWVTKKELETIPLGLNIEIVRNKLLNLL